jgi:excisionase family DNA binding protein
MKGPDLSGWLTKAQAAERLAISERTLDRLGKKGPERRLRPRPGKKPEPVFNPVDVEAMAPKEEAHVVPYAAVSRGAGLPEPTLGVALAFTAIEKVAERLAIRGPERWKPWMTIAEASEYSGLSESFLRRLVRESQLPSVRDRAVKVRRADLDNLASSSTLAKSGAVG